MMGVAQGLDRVGEVRMLVIQHVWRRWTKATRGADKAAARLALAEAHPLPPGATGNAWLHAVWALERDGFAKRERVGPVTADDWAHQEPAHAANLRWTLRDGGVDIGLLEPWPSLRVTPWPGHLPTPLLRVRAGEVVRIDWNGRFRSSAGGSDLSYFMDHHIYWLAVHAAPPPDLFTAAVPRKHVDLRTGIY